MEHNCKCWLVCYCRKPGGTFGPGEFVWHDEGVEMTHGASDEEDVDILFITNKALDMNYL